jgi:hypothetical protein
MPDHTVSRLYVEYGNPVQPAAVGRLAPSLRVEGAPIKRNNRSSVALAARNNTGAKLNDIWVSKVEPFRRHGGCHYSLS